MAIAKKTASPQTAKPAAGKKAAATATAAAQPTALLVPEDKSKFPEGFVPAFNRVEMPKDGINARISDGLCCVAMLTGQTLDTITELSYELGLLTRRGPCWAYPSTLRRLLAEYSLIASADKEAPNTDAFEGHVAIVAAEYDPDTLFGRYVIHHHMTGPGWVMNVVYDPAWWVEDRHKLTRDYAHLWTPKQPLHHMLISPKTAGEARTK